MPEIIYLMGPMPVEVVITYAYSKLLDMRSVPAFFAIRLGFCLLLVFTREALPPSLRMGTAIALYMLIPLFCSKGAFARRAMVALLAGVLISIAEIAGALPWVMLTGSTVANLQLAQQFAGEFWFMHLFHILVVTTLFFALYALLGRVAKSESECDDGRGILLFSAFPLTQLLLLSAGLAMNQYLLVQSVPFFWVLFALCFVCLVMDFLLFAMLDNYNKRQLAAQRAQLLQEQFDRSLAQYSAVAQGVMEVSKARHDLRNHLQVVRTLSEKGAFDKASAYLTDVKAQVDASVATSAANNGLL